MCSSDLNAGRPRKLNAPRYKSGRLIAKDQTVEPNPFLLRQRAVILGDCQADPSVTDDPMTLAHARGWLTQRQVEAGRRYAALYHASHPAKPCTAPHEAPPAGEREDRTWGQIPSWEIGALFDRMMDATARRGRSESSQVNARRRYLSLSAELTTRERLEIFNAFCLGMWPKWELNMIAGRPLGDDARWRRASLISGLNVINRLLTSPQKRSTFQIVEMKSSVCCA